MDRTRITTLALVATCLAQGAWIVSGQLFAPARAQDPASADSAPERQPLADAPKALTCRLFGADVASGSTIDSADRTTEVGQWVGERQDEGWRLFAVDFEVGQKATGYPQGHLQVCLAR